MKKVYAKLRDGFIVTYSVPPEEVDNVFNWLKDSTPAVEVWKDDPKWSR